MKCGICDNESKSVFTATILNKYSIQYFFCDKCGFLQTEKPYWLEEAYKLPIKLSDTGLVQRNFLLSQKVSVLLYFIFNKNEKFIDYGGGYGLFTRLMRDIGFDFYHYDPNTENIFARGFESNDFERHSALTTFETFEHFVNPLQEIEKMLKYSSNIIFTTELLPNKLPKPENWWYFGLEHGQHISFYSKKALTLIASKYKLNFYTNGNLHMFTEKSLSSLYYRLLLKSSKIGTYRLILSKMNSKTQADSNLYK